VKRSLIWFLAPIMAVMLTACEEVPEGNASTGGTATTEEGVEISLGTGNGDNFSAGAMTAAVTSLSAGGTTSVTVNLVNVADDNTLYSGIPVEVEFESQCVASGKATFTNTTVITSTGSAVTTYQAEGCVGSDTITAKYDTATAAVSVTVSPADVNSIGFTGTGFNASIAYGNSANGGQSNFSATQFALIDDRGNPVEGQTVTFALSSNDPNHGAALSNTDDISDASGFVETRVNAGAQSANLRVTATFTPSAGDAISTQSSAIAVNTGPADWDSFVMGPSQCAVPDAFGIFNTTTSITANAADRHNNPVADGTVISFWTEQGRIKPSCETTDGSCAVTWWSGGGTPVNEDDDSDTDADLGLSTIVAYTVGEDSFIELTEKNGVFDVGETIIPAPEMFHDYEFDLAYTNGTDTYVDYNVSGSYDTDNTINSNVYRGALCSSDAELAGHCNEKAVIVWGHTRIALSTTFMSIITPDPLTPVTWNVSGGSQVFYVTVSDQNGNYPPAGTTITATSDAVSIEVVGGSPSAESCPAGQGAHSFALLVKPDGIADSAPIKILVESPTGNSSSYFYVTGQD